MTARPRARDPVIDAGGSVVRYLASDEDIVLVVRRHVAVLLRPFLEAVGVLVIASLLSSALTPAPGDNPVATLLGLVTVAFALRLFWRGLEWWVDRVVVTDQRMFEVSGILTRRVASMPLGKLTDLTYSRSIPGRMLGYGDLVVETPGQQQAVTHIDFLPSPDDFYRTLTEMVMGRIARSPRAGRIASPARADGDEAPGPRPAGRDSGRDDDDTGPLPRVIV
jgi:hypothetical protein